MSVQGNVNQWLNALTQLSIGKSLVAESKKTRGVIEKSIDNDAGPTGPTGPTHSYYDEQGNIKMPTGGEENPVDPHFNSPGPMGPMGPMAGPDGGPIQSRPRKPTAAETVAQEAQRRRDIDNWRTITMQRMKDVGYSNKAIKKFEYKTRGETNE